MKFQDSSFNGLKVTVGTKSVTHARTLQKQYAPSTFFKVGGIKKKSIVRLAGFDPTTLRLQVLHLTIMLKLQSVITLVQFDGFFSKINQVIYSSSIS